MAANSERPRRHQNHAAAARRRFVESFLEGGRVVASVSESAEVRHV
jgi:hypothetical protein